MFIAAVAVIATAVYFITPELVSKTFSSLTVPSSVPENKMIEDAGGFLSQFKISTMTIVFIVLAFAGIGIVDKIVSRRRSDQKPVSFLV